MDPFMGSYTVDTSSAYGDWGIESAMNEYHPVGVGTEIEFGPPNLWTSDMDFELDLDLLPTDPEGLCDMQSMQDGHQMKSCLVSQ